ncbi:MAG: 3'-5' exoribonuclease [Prevotellaceae bacterium]|nr:3'-5' exoribonuclease [Candidatus Minthosoma equi]
MTSKELEEKAKKTDKNYIKDDGVVYIKLSDGRLWCPSLQARGTKYEITEISLKSMRDNTIRTKDFVAIDFETAKSYSNPCQIGIAVVRNGIIEESFERLIKPRDNKYSRDTIKVHGITPERTENEDEFPIVWNDIKQYFEDEYIVAHNAKFDISVLQSVLDEYKIDYPSIRSWMCTCELVHNWPLGVACEAFDIEFDEEKHHGARYDAEACAKIYLSIVNNESIVPNFNADEVRARHKAAEDRRKNVSLFCKKISLNKLYPEKDLSIVKNTDNPFYNKEILLTGDFCICDGDRKELGKVLHEMGAGFKGVASNKVDYFLVGSNPGSDKIRRIEEINAKGGTIVKINESELLDILEGRNWDKYKSLLACPQKKTVSYTIPNLFDSVQEISKNPFFDRRVCITGNFFIKKNDLKRKIETLGASKVDNKLTRDTHYLLIGSGPDEEVLKRLELNIHDGWNPIVLYENELKMILRGEYEKFHTDKIIRKNLHLTKNHYYFEAPVIMGEEMSSRITSPVIYDESGLINPLSQKEIFIAGNLSGNIELLSQIIGNMGGYANRIYYEDTNIILLGDSTFEKMINGETDETLLQIEKEYNNSQSPAFNIQFTSETELLCWVNRRLKMIENKYGKGFLENDNTAQLYNKYIESRKYNK